MRSATKLVVTLLVGAVLGGVTVVPRASAQADRDRDVGARLERLERQVRMMAERQEQFVQRMGAAMDRRGPQPPPQWGPQGPRPAGPPAATVNWPGDRAKRAFWKLLGLGRLVMLILIIVHISLAVWVFGDIKKRGEGHGIFIVLALLAGIPAGILYALIRIGDRKPVGPQTG
ncbi:hypothetical protein HQ590_12240 [bacterium]|nr:hypothetical protein [bacterium]